MNLLPVINSYRQELKILWRKRRRVRTTAEENQILRLPDTMASLEKEIDSVVDELGAKEF